MVYGALFTAMLTGSATGGATVMAGFGLGYAAGLALTTLGIRALVRAEMRADLRMLAGFAIALFGFATVWVPHPYSTRFACRPEISPLARRPAHRASSIHCSPAAADRRPRYCRWMVAWIRIDAHEAQDVALSEASAHAPYHQR